MFPKKTYMERRWKLKVQFDSGIILFLGNEESPMNYSDNTYKFRQDSNFLYFWGLDEPALAAVIDIDNNKEIIFGENVDLDDIIWMGPQPSLQEKAKDIGVKEARSLPELSDFLDTSREIHYLPTYRGDQVIHLSQLLDCDPAEVEFNASEKLIRAVVGLREQKTDEEVLQIETAVDLTAQMHIAAMEMLEPGMFEYEACGAMEGIALAAASRISFPSIFSVEGETLHNHYHGNQMKEGDILINDSGAESELHYAGDITRTIPVSGKFTGRQRDIYQIVLEANKTGIKASKPGITYKEVHLQAARVIAEGLKELGLMRGNLEEAVANGAHALFFPHGLGHMMGLDVHDMEGLGEDYVGYDEDTQRSDQFGLASLRLGKELKPGYVLTVEPGIYFIPELIDRWKEDGKHEAFINYDKVEEYKDFGGVRIEDDILITEKKQRILGMPIPKEVDEVERICQGE
ncbi:MAG: aminopeptidase P family protein [Candidatus Marinimicrobia bacterium]|nr:aminopeptidase P family protein [Candidatus Neomarinimicrobiota bacterium]